jgi:Zn-dependent protease
MNQTVLLDGLLSFIGFFAFVALHEFAHAWMADRCGDDTPRLQGRLTLDPLAHVDLIGTIILPLALVLLGAAGGHVLVFGWGKPVQVNLNNFRVRRRDDILVSVAGPVMNLITAVVMLGLWRLGTFVGIPFCSNETFFNSYLQLTQLSMLLFFFNLLPVPPLDGGHILRNLIGISDEAYAQISQYSFLIFIIMMRSTFISGFVNDLATKSVIVAGGLFGWHLSVV